MKFVHLSLALSGFVLAGAAFAQTAAQQSAAEKVILKSCAGCHDTSMTPSFVDDSGAVDWASVKQNASKISARVQSTTRPMPPKAAPASYQPSAQDKADLLAYTAAVLNPTGSTGSNGNTGSTGSTGSTNSDAIVPLSKLSVEPGFKIEVFGQVKGARSLAVHSSGIVFVGTGGFSDVDPQGRVSALVPTSTGVKTVVLASGLDNPNGVALDGDDLYVAEFTRVIKFKGAVATVKSLASGTSARVTYSVVKDGFRQQDDHGWKYIAVGPDHKLYINVGANCNVCAEDLDNAAGIFRMNLDGSNYEQVARGVRNSVGIAFDPSNNDLWFTDNGRDNLGDTIPGDELNHLTTQGQNFGFPSCFAATITDPTYGKGVDCNASTFTKPAVVLGPHVASLGLTFYSGSKFPASYQNAIFIAEHGSWNSTSKVGYRLTIVQPTTDGYSYRPFIKGWVDAAGKTNWGRPVDVKNYIDGTLLLSDDNAGIVYRISPK